jgi:hypothetical protein
MTDFFNRIGRFLPIMVTTRVGQIRCNRWSEQMQVTGQVECKRVVKWSAISQLVEVLDAVRKSTEKLASE